ncbi:Hypothetical_protein [Hexamita inflata]|uniref:Hypothetical_protein n=1 Tax=Hexamita inflata TaxID=28002 RepID=A0AA86RH29_9EUKA|nr:Hypothetical protein HINF_LOCUS64047 [Hexamita inflata]
MKTRTGTSPLIRIEQIYYDFQIYTRLFIKMQVELTQKFKQYVQILYAGVPGPITYFYFISKVISSYNITSDSTMLSFQIRYLSSHVMPGVHLFTTDIQRSTQFNLKDRNAYVIRQDRNQKYIAVLHNDNVDKMSSHLQNETKRIIVQCS